jgi:hypothetical protein
LLVLQEKKEEDSTTKQSAEVQLKAPPLLVDVIDLNKQFKIWTFVLKKDCPVSYNFCW